MAALVGKFKEKVSRRKASRDMPRAFDTFTTVDTVTTVTTNSNDGTEPVTVTYRPFTPIGPTRLSLENSAFHVSRGNKRPTSWENPLRTNTARSDSTGQNVGQHRRVVSLGEQQRRTGEVIPQRSSSRRDFDDPSDFVHAANTRPNPEPRSPRNTVPAPPLPPLPIRSQQQEGLDKQEDVVEEMIPQRASSKHAVPGAATSQQPPIRAAVTTRQPDSTIDETPRTDPVSIPTRTYSRYHLESGLFSKPISSKARQSKDGVVSEDGAPGPSRATQRSPHSPQSPRSVQSPKRVVISPDLIEKQEAPTETPVRTAELKSQQPEAEVNRIAKSNESRPRRSSINRKPLPTQAAVPTAGSTTKPDHLQLPPGFNLESTEQTHVSEDWRPAVTHETIIKEKTEIVQEEITRDIHVHHYYTYLQPIKVVEVLPAKHFFLDLETGAKTEIPTPPGWTMPINMMPNSPDTSPVKAWTRHYLVDNEHPNGIIEPPPLKHEFGYQNLRQEAIANQR